MVSEYLLLPVDWNTPLSLSKTWDTKIQESINGKEVRSAIYSFPRNSFRYTYTLLSQKEISYLNRRIYKNLHNIWGIPYWQDQTFLSSQAVSGQPVLNVESTEYRNFEVGGSCVILAGIGEYEVGQILSFTATTITLQDDLNTTWDSGVLVMPLLQGRIDPVQTINISGNNGVFQLEISESVDTDIIKANPSISFPTYLSYSVFNLKPNMRDQRVFKYQRTYELLKFYGVSVSLTNKNESSTTFTNDFLFFTKNEIQEFIDFFNYNKGRYGNFWIPSYNDDVNIISSFSDSDVTFSVDLIDWANYWEDNNTGIYLNFKFSDGTEIQRRIISEPSSNQLTIDSAIGKTCSSDELSGLNVSFLYFGRFDIDRIDLLYETDTIASTKVTFKTIQEFNIT